MADTPNPAERVKLQRDANGHPLPGQPPFSRNGGRPPLPECFTSLEPLALAGLAAMATGVVLDQLIPTNLTPEQQAAAKLSLENDAADTKGKLRLDARDRMIDRVRGKVKETVEHTGNIGQIVGIEVRFKDPEPREKAIEGTLSKPKRLESKDAE